MFTVRMTRLSLHNLDDHDEDDGNEDANVEDNCCRRTWWWCSQCGWPGWAFIMAVLALALGRGRCALHNTLPCSTSYFTQRNNDSEGNKSTFTTQTNALFQNCNSQYHAAQISNKQSFEETNNKQNVCTLHILIIPGGANMKIQNIRCFTSYSRPQKVTVAPYKWIKRRFLSIWCFTLLSISCFTPLSISYFTLLSIWCFTLLSIWCFTRLLLN